MGAVAGNFLFLEARREKLAQLGALAEHRFADDPPASLIKLRQLGKFLAKEIAARHGLLPATSGSFDAVEGARHPGAAADHLKAEDAHPRALLDRLETAILVSAFRGEPVPQDPNDEPAGALLERIRARRAAAPRLTRGRRAKDPADA